MKIYPEKKVRIFTGACACWAADGPPGGRPMRRFLPRRQETSRSAGRSCACGGSRPPVYIIIIFFIILLIFLHYYIIIFSILLLFYIFFIIILLLF